AFLGRCGWRIIIPEMVAIETAGVLLGTTRNLNDLFAGNPRGREEINFGDCGAKLFLERARDGRLPDIDITPTNPSSAVGIYLDSLRTIVADPNLPAHKKRGLLALAQKRNRQHFGDQACFDDIAQLLDTPADQTAPVFFLANDRGALDEVYR